MFNRNILKDILKAYKKDFVTSQWPGEKFKWEAVKWFQDNWDVNAPDFPGMLSRVLGKTRNLLASNNNFPQKMIIRFAETFPEEVRSMFINLYDEKRDLLERIESFKNQSSVILKKYGNSASNHYQTENSISTYLWLRYPDKYYIYKFGEVKSVAEKLEADYSFKKGRWAENIHSFLRFYDELCIAIREDEELVSLFKSQLSDDCYPDPELRTLTFDIGFYSKRIK